MNRYIEEIKISIKSSKTFYISFSILMVFCMIIGNFIVSASQELYQKQNTFNDIFNNTNYYKIGDNFIGKYEEEFNQDINKYSKLIALNNALENNPHFTYLENYNNPVELPNFIGGDIFLEGYEEGDISNSKIIINTSLDDFVEISQVKALWVNYSLLNEFDISVSDGRLFVEKEYSTYKNTLPVILGSDYNGVFKVGDIIPVDTFIFNSKGSFEVIGILEKNSIIYSDTNNLLCLDRYMILPSITLNILDLNQNNKGAFEFFTYIQGNGIIKTNLSAEDTQNIVCEICDNLNIKPYYYILEADNQQSYIFNIDMKKMVELFKMIFVFMMILLIILFSTYIIIKIRYNLKLYSILLTFGYSYTDIAFLLLLESLVILLSSSFISIIITYIILKINGISFCVMSFIFNIVVCFLITIIISIISIFELNKYDLSTYLRKR